MEISVVKILYDLLKDFIKERSSSKVDRFNQFVKPIYEQAEVISRDYYTYCVWLERKIKTEGIENIAGICEEARAKRLETLHLRDKIRASVNTVLTFKNISNEERAFFAGVEELFYVNPENRHHSLLARRAERIDLANFTESLIAQSDTKEGFAASLYFFMNSKNIRNSTLAGIGLKLKEDEDYTVAQFKRELKSEVNSYFSATTSDVILFRIENQLHVGGKLSLEHLLRFLQSMQRGVREAWKTVVASYTEIEFEALHDMLSS